MTAEHPRPHSGRWFEELEVGLVIPHAVRRTITEADNVLFTSITMNPAWLHLDFDYATNETEFGRPVVNSMLTLAMVVGISVHETTLGTTAANLGFTAVEFPSPLFHGDTLHVETEVVGSRVSASRPTRGIVTFEHRAFDQHETLCCRAVRAALMLCQPQSI